MQVQFLSWIPVNVGIAQQDRVPDYESGDEGSNPSIDTKYVLCCHANICST